MASIMADHNVEGHFVVLLRLWTSDVWRTVWESLDIEAPSRLPVLTIADPELVLASRDYAERVAIQVLEYLLELDHFRGVGRLFVP